LLGDAVDSAAEGENVPGIHQFHRPARVGAFQNPLRNGIIWVIESAQDDDVVGNVVVDVRPIDVAFFIFERGGAGTSTRRSGRP
jgi:hypothetical protein